MSFFSSRNSGCCECNDTILWFIILFLLIFSNDGLCCRRNDCGCNDRGNDCCC